MTRFYEELWENRVGAGEALRRAQEAWSKAQEPPDRWAGFTLAGEWR